LLLAIPFGPRFDNRHGGRVVAQLLARLVERHQVAVVYLARPDDPPMEPSLASRCAVVERVELPPARWPPVGWRHRIHVLSTPVTVRPSPVAAVFNRHFARAVRDIAVAFKPDIIQIERDVLAYCLPFLNGVAPLARVLVCHDPGLTASEDLAETTVRRQKLAHRLDAATWRRYWARTLSDFDAVVAFTEADSRTLRGISPGLRVFRIPLGIDLPPEPCNPVGEGEPDVLFIGGYAHPPNADAAIRLLRSIMPLARRRVPGLRLMLVGEKPTDEMRRVASAHDVITGSVPSVTPYVDKASLVVLPIRVGGGMRVKLLEALAAGKAVVASPLAASGLDVTDGRELVLAESDQEFADAIAMLLGDEAARSQLASAARDWACNNLTWESRVHEYERLYRHLRDSHG
jgi:glycosyltransferase involved in cell wall biosynthesis